MRSLFLFSASAMLISFGSLTYSEPNTTSSQMEITTTDQDAFVHQAMEEFEKNTAPLKEEDKEAIRKIYNDFMARPSVTKSATEAARYVREYPTNTLYDWMTDDYESAILSSLVYAFAYGVTLPARLVSVPASALGAGVGGLSGLAAKISYRGVAKQDGVEIRNYLNRLYSGLFAQYQQFLMMTPPNKKIQGVDEAILKVLRSRLDTQLQNDLIYVSECPVNLQLLITASTDPLFAMAAKFVNSDLTYDHTQKIRIDESDYEALFNAIPTRTQDTDLHRKLCIASLYYLLKEFREYGYEGPSAVKWALSF